MIVGNVEIHNAGALETVPGFDSKGIVRVPETVRNQMNEGARRTGSDSIGCEVRFVTDAPLAKVYLSSIGSCEVRVYRGNFEAGRHQIDGQVCCVELCPPDAFLHTDESKLQMGGFASNVWRICMGRSQSVVYHGINAFGHDVRPPKPEELPSLKLLTYGSSITHSSLDGYPHMAARILKADVQNKGLSGSCHCESVMADYLAEQCEWDVMTCEMGINMRGGYTPEVFRERVTYLLTKLTNTHPGKPVVAINLYPNSWTPGWVADDRKHELSVERETAFNEIVEGVVEELGSKSLHFVNGSEILDDFTGLSADLLHPNPYGHATMGMNLAAKLKAILG